MNALAAAPGLSEYRQQLRQRLDGCSARPSRPAGPAQVLPLLRPAPQGNEPALEQSLSLQDDPYLMDHVVDGKPVLPMAVALELMAQRVAAGWPQWQIAELRDARQFSGIVFENRNPRRVILRATDAGTDADGYPTVTVELIDVHTQLPRYRATAVLSAALPQGPLLQQDPLPDAVTIDAARTYNEILFHGESFHLIRAITALAPPGIDAEVHPSSPHRLLGERHASGRWLFDPGLLDVPPQLAFVWARELRNAGALPIRFGRIQRYGDEPLEGLLRLQLRFKPASHPQGLCYDAQIADAGGRLRLAITDGESTMSGALNRLSRGHPDFRREAG
ncbi:hypothetical protein D0B54_23795 [Solimonas sp. K1W22B-7]|uniref:polyketide synthase dehydratase domain-containing protein n=1 Tax=Solimonas sp. K1W22B-7 TaxID=2303331 RepID=UPI000E32DDDB|nr:polyketide synthase dehydratase domain-containing protein [Solimonas sp. K1W22B-7]AXQ31522.1 hypothetical protein D0B54_23795 [Solimonas sp. K1W22B-7]